MIITAISLVYRNHAISSIQKLCHKVEIRTCYFFFQASEENLLSFSNTIKVINEWMGLPAPKIILVTKNCRQRLT